MLEHAFTQTALKLTYTIDEYGQNVLQSTEEVMCRFREDSKSIDNGNMSIIDCDALAHFKGNSGVRENDMFIILGYNYSVIKAVYARRLGSNEVVFVKAYLKRNTFIS